MRKPVLVIGGGLAGLSVARLLHRAGIDFQLLEARDRLGGRILTTDAVADVSTDGFDLGPSWFWPLTQPSIAALIDNLGLSRFPQNSEGDVIFQRMSREVPQRYRGLQQEPHSMRLVGGAGALIRALASGLPASTIHLNSRVQRVALDAGDVVASFCQQNGSEQILRASHVMIAVPPRLLEATVTFAPSVDPAARRWRDTPTWMAPHAKVFAVYDRPFWRDAGLSGTAQSMAGPLVEIHDATTFSGRPALFGFVGLPAEQRRAVGKEALTTACIQQLVKLFGPEAGRPAATLFKDWAADPLTATRDDQTAGGHAIADDRPWVSGPWEEYMSLAGSETSDIEPGYLAGAVAAAERAAAGLMNRLDQRAEPSRQ